MTRNHRKCGFWTSHGRFARSGASAPCCNGRQDRRVQQDLGRSTIWTKRRMKRLNGIRQRRCFLLCLAECHPVHVYRYGATQLRRARSLSAILLTSAGLPAAMFNAFVRKHAATFAQLLSRILIIDLTWIRTPLMVGNEIQSWIFCSGLSGCSVCEGSSQMNKESHSRSVGCMQLSARKGLCHTQAFHNPFPRH